MALPPIPLVPPSRDGDSLPGRRGPIGGRGIPAERLATAAASTDPASVTERIGDAPAAVTDASRGALPALRQVSDQAGRLGAGLDQLQDARLAVGTARTVLARMSNVAVVAIDRRLLPAERAALQRQVDLAARELDELAADTALDERYVHGPTADLADGEAPSRAPGPLRALRAAVLGVDDLSVRSSDQAAAATSVLDVAVARLDRTARLLDRAAARLDGMLAGLVGPADRPSRSPASSASFVARSATATLRSALVNDPGAALEAHPHGLVARLGPLLDVPPARE